MKYFAIDAVLEMRKRTLMKRIKKIYPPWKIYSGKLSNFLFSFTAIFKGRLPLSKVISYTVPDIPSVSASLVSSAPQVLCIPLYSADLLAQFLHPIINTVYKVS